MASVKMIIAFNKKIIKAITKLGAEHWPNQEFGKRYSIDTKAGKLDILLDSEERASGIHSIFCRFEDPKKAVEVLTPTNSSNLNKHSGKWNYHFVNGKDCFEIFLMSLKEIL